jgi:hypothetical protein
VRRLHEPDQVEAEQHIRELEAYELELNDPRLGRAIQTQYAVRVLEPGTGR